MCLVGGYWVALAVARILLSLVFFNSLYLNQNILQVQK